MKFFIKLTLAFIRRFKTIIFVSFILGVLVFFGFQKLSPVIQNLNVVRIGLTGRFTPEELPREITSLISKGLTKISADGSVYPDLATWETPDKGKTWVFKLREDQFWQDNKSLVNTDVNYQFSDVEVNYSSTNTINFKLKEPFIPFPSIVSKPLFKNGLLGLGDWRVKNIKLNGRYVQELKIENKEGKKVLYKFYPTEDATKIAFKMGKVDLIQNMLSSQPFDKWKGVNVEKVKNTRQVVTLFFNTQDKLLSDKSVRQALMYAINKNELGPRALGPIAQSSWAYNPQVKEYAYDVGRSKEILNDIPHEVLNNAQITISTTSLLLDNAEKIKKYWEAIGIKTNVQIYTGISSDFQVLMTILDLPDDPDQYPLWHSTQTATNISKYSNPRIDKLLEDGRTELDNEARKKIYLDFQRFLLEDLPASFLYNPTYYNISR